jgi:hypothetical protein
MQKDLDFISGKFFDQEIPKKQRYLLKYFKTDLQQAFLRYYLTCGKHSNFVDHTGFWCSERMLWQLRARYHRLVNTYEEAKKSLTEEGMEMVHRIESGKFILTKK